MDGELAFAGAWTHPSEAIANLPMSTRGLSTPLGAAREIQEGIAVDPLLVGCGLKTHDVNQAQLDNKITIVINPNLFPITL